MKKIIILTVLLFLTIVSFSDYTLTRGPLTGEIYYIGPTYTGLGIYHSLDYGITATCVDSTTDATGIVADLTEGVLYYRNMGQGLYISDDYGQQGTWELRNGGMYPDFASGRVEGEIYNIFITHSEDFGYTFVPHSYTGYFGNYFECEIDNQSNTAYLLTYKSNVADSVYLLKSIDNYENLFLNKTFAFHWNEAIELTRGTNSGELYLFNYNREILLLSSDYADTWININDFNFVDFYGLSVVGGRQEGEIYFKCDYVNMMWQNAHTYIFHSTDYGKTFEVFHPFSKGNEPVLANFSTANKDVQLSYPIEFCNYSIGKELEYQWDFDNDGTIDSYEESPSYVYPDTGYYSVKLTIVGDSSNTFIRENYIHIIDTVSSIQENDLLGIRFLSNPIKNLLNIQFSTIDDYQIFTYNLQGIKINEKIIKQQNSAIINFSNTSSGIYLVNIKLKNKTFSYKIIKN